MVTSDTLVVGGREFCLWLGSPLPSRWGSLDTCSAYTSAMHYIWKAGFFLFLYPASAHSFTPIPPTAPPPAPSSPPGEPRWPLQTPGVLVIFTMHLPLSTDTVLLVHFIHEAPINSRSGSPSSQGPPVVCQNRNVSHSLGQRKRQGAPVVETESYPCLCSAGSCSVQPLGKSFGLVHSSLLQSVAHLRRIGAWFLKWTPMEVTAQGPHTASGTSPIQHLCHLYLCGQPTRSSDSALWLGRNNRTGLGGPTLEIFGFANPGWTSLPRKQCTSMGSWGTFQLYCI